MSDLMADLNIPRFPSVHVGVHPEEGLHLLPIKEPASFWKSVQKQGRVQDWSGCPSAVAYESKARFLGPMRGFMMACLYRSRARDQAFVLN